MSVMINIRMENPQLFVRFPWIFRSHACHYRKSRKDNIRKGLNISQFISDWQVHLSTFTALIAWLVAAGSNKYIYTPRSSPSSRLLFPISTLGEPSDCKSSYMHRTASERSEKYLQEPLLSSECIAMVAVFAYS